MKKLKKWGQRNVYENMESLELYFSAKYFLKPEKRRLRLARIAARYWLLETRKSMKKKAASLIMPTIGTENEFAKIEKSRKRKRLLQTDSRGMPHILIFISVELFRLPFTILKWGASSRWSSFSARCWMGTKSPSGRGPTIVSVLSITCQKWENVPITWGFFVI